MRKENLQMTVFKIPGKRKFKMQKKKHEMGEQWARDPNSYNMEAHLHIQTGGAKQSKLQTERFAVVS